MKRQIIEYYISERQWSINGLWIAIAVLALSVILWRTGAVHSMQRGISLSLAVAGTLFMIATDLTIRHNNQRITLAKQITEQNEQVLQEQKTTRMENVLENAYKAGFISFSIAFVTGIVFLLVLKTPVSKGIALGILLFGAYGLTMEMLSMRQNRGYLEKIKNYQVSTKKS